MKLTDDEILKIERFLDQESITLDFLLACHKRFKSFVASIYVDLIDTDLDDNK